MGSTNSINFFRFFLQIIFCRTTLYPLWFNAPRITNKIQANYLNLALEKYSDDKKKIFNTRGKAFKTLNLDIDCLSKEEIIQLFLSDGKLIKRPFLIYEGKNVILVFKELRIGLIKS